MGGFVYIWFDTHNKMYYVGCHWGSPDDGYICSSPWMKKAYKNRPHHFRRRIIKFCETKEEMIREEDRYISMIKPEELRVKYYNLRIVTWELWHHKADSSKTVGEKISRAKTGKKSGRFSEERKLAISEGKRKAFEKRREETGSNYAPEIQGAWQNNGGYEACVTPEANVKRSESLKKTWAKRLA